MSDNEPRRRWNRRESDGAAWGDENSTIINQSPHRKSRRFIGSQTTSYREPIQISAAFKERIAAAARASIVTFTTFSLLVFSGQEVLPVAWIGNVFAISVLKSTLGDTFLSIKDVIVPMIPVALISWAVSAALSASSTDVYRILLPFVVAIAALVVFLCPWPLLTMKNLMLLIFYLVVSNPLSLRNVAAEDVSSSMEDVGPFFAPALVGTICIGILISLLVHVVMMKSTRSTTASRQVLMLMRQVSHETNQLLLSLTRYMQSFGKADVAQQERTLIDFHTKRRRRLLNRLNEYLPAMRVESKLRFLSNNGIDIDAVETFVACAKKQQKHAELVQVATTQTLLGEDYTSMNRHVREVKEKISEHLGYVLEKLALEYSKSETTFFFTNATKEDKEQIVHELQHSMDDYLKAMKQAIYNVEALLLNNDDASRSTAGPMIRVRVTFLALFSFVHELHDVLNTTKDYSNIVPETTTAISRFASGLKMKWLWKDISKRRLATKTAVGLSLASLWVSIPYLNGHVAYTNSVWVGITVASISLETTGAAYTKALDRLWGTLIAAAYSLFVGKLFHVNAIAKLLALTIITFISTLISNPNRPYASRYAATSVGSILYGSFDKQILVDDYVPTRIMLIFVGVAIFLFIEMLLFPRSSRTIVQAQTVQLFEDLEQFFYQSSKTCSAISSVSGKDKESSENFFDPLWMLRHGYKEINVMDSLEDSVTAVKNTYALAKDEVRPGKLEPFLGMGISLDSVGYDRLLSESENMIVQIDLLVVTLRSLRGYYGHMSKEHSARDLQWPSLLSASLLRIAQQLSQISDEFRIVFPHGLFRSGARDITHIIGAVSLFRRFAQVRLSILADVEERHATYLDDIALAGEEVRYTPGFRLTIALAISAMLGLGQGLQNCGRHLERIVETSFPIEEVKCSANNGQATAAIQYGESSESNDS